MIPATLMAPHTQEAVAHALDSAIVKVAARQFQRLSRGLSTRQIAMEVYRSLASFEDLKKDVMPRYNEWDALFYLLWYQPKQINLAYSAIVVATGLKDFMVQKEELYVADVGCGALAMQFAVALAAAEARRKGEAISSVRFDSIDTSRPMLDTGAALWDEFKRQVRRDRGLRHIAETLDIVTWSAHEDLQGIQGPSASEEGWTSAIHAVYQSNRRAIRTALSRVERRKGTIGIITSALDKVATASSVSPFEERGYVRRPQDRVYARFKGTFGRTTEWKSSLYETIRAEGSTFNGRYVGIRYRLTNPVTAVWPAAACLIYTKRRPT